MARVILEQVSKRFGDVKAVDSLNLDIRDKEFVTLVGPSGCGKTTTLRLIAGLEKVTDGAIYFDDQVVSHLPANHRDIAMVFQSYALYPHMKVYDNISFALRMMKIPRDEIDRRVQWAATMLGIDPLLERKPRELSGGQRQRVALGRAIVREPACFLLDEPLSNLDAKLRVTMRAELKRLHHDIGRTFIYVTHDQAEALTMSDRIAIMNYGQLQQYGTPDEVYNQPANIFVAGFIGSPAMNFIDGELIREDGRLRFQRGAERYPIPEQWAQRLDQQKLQGAVTLGARPEAIGISYDGDAGLQGTVYVEEPLGSDIFLTVDVEDVKVIVRTNPEFHTTIGDAVKLHLNPQKIYFFDTKSGQAIR
ncbi:MAG TPA: ABC transporter ATP-binding protein [Caldilineaceae bacterium]|nr:ABC transporter ATP-binding protein [Caldilineaceae bacterium]